uniref:DUF642 domain-containing protein n=1 Tax=Leersia perrieri TaxID=77586 RepID=A0A0D9XQP6_9ORYZ
MAAKLLLVLAMAASTLLLAAADGDNSTAPALSPSPDPTPTPPPPPPPSPPPPPPPTPTAYEMLQKYGFPVGILPEGVQGYKLSDDGSSFEAYLAGDCKFRAAKKYVLHYSSRIAGRIADGSIKSLEGVRVKELFWLRISELDVDGDHLKIHVGPFTKSIGVDQLAESPHCN